MKNLNECIESIKDSKSLPKQKHYVIVIFGKETRSEQDYDHADKYYTYEAVNIEYLVILNEKIWKDKILKLESDKSYSGKQDYAAFVVDKIAEVKLNVSVDIDIKG